MSERWKSKNYIVKPTKDPKTMSQREAMEWEKAELIQRIKDMPANLKPKFSEGYEIRIGIIDELLKKTDAELNAPVIHKVVNDDEEQSVIVAGPKTKHVSKAAEKPAEPDLNPLLQSEIMRNETKIKKPKTEI